MFGRKKIEEELELIREELIYKQEQIDRLTSLLKETNEKLLQHKEDTLALIKDKTELTHVECYYYPYISKKIPVKDVVIELLHKLGLNTKWNYGREAHVELVDKHQEDTK